MILNKVREAIKKHSLIKRSDRIIVGVSGGPDSVALLYLLNSLKKDLNLNLHIAHLDHMLRVDSAADAKFVQNLALKLNIPITCAKVNIKALGPKGSLEEAARTARLKFFFRVAKETKAAKIALAHNFEDQAETVLMRLLRGTGLYGLSGISAKRNIAGFSIIRPLIYTKRREIEKYLKQNKITSRLDKSNYESIYFRNKIRNHLLPLLEQNYNRNIHYCLNNIAQTASLDYNYLLLQAKRALKQVGPRINLKKFLMLHPAIQRMLIRLRIAQLKGDTRAINFQHIREIEDLISNRPDGSIVDLPKSVSVQKKHSYLRVYRR